MVMLPHEPEFDRMAKVYVVVLAVQAHGLCRRLRRPAGDGR